MAEMSFPLENTDYGAEEAQLWFSGRTSGVFAADELAVSAGDGMSVVLGEGRLWMAYTKFAGVVYANTTGMPLTIPTADAYFDRIDRVIVRFDRTGNTIKAMVISGAPSSNPTAPSITRNDSTFDISLAQVYVQTGTTEITNAAITDERFNENVCGLMEDGVTGLPTGMISAQWNSIISEMLAKRDNTFEQMQAQWDAMLKQLSDALENVQGGSILQKNLYTVMVPADGWTENEDGSYSQTVTVEGVLASDAATVDVDMSNVTVDTAADIQDAWAMVGSVESQGGGFMLTCYDSVPEIDLPMKAEVIR